MLIDSTHRSWFLGTLLVTLAGAAAYFPYAALTPGGPRGGTLIGLLYGIFGMGMILFAGFLSVRKKLLLLRIGPVSWWMKGHLWLGLLSLPVILLHAAFSFGGTLTTILMVLLMVVVGSGLLGAFVQHALPAAMAAEIPDEKTYETIARARANLRSEAYELVWAASGPLPEAGQERSEIEKLTGKPPPEPKTAAPAAGTRAAGTDVLKSFYVGTVLPFLAGGADHLNNEIQAAFLFERVRTSLDPTLHGTLSDLEKICDETRRLAQQGRLQVLLHGWLLLHIPLSMALLALMVVHAVMALYY